MDDGGSDEVQWAWPTLHGAQRSVLLDLLVHGSRSRADLARRAGLSRGSLTRLTRDLVDLGLIAEGVVAEPNGRGRPAESVTLVGDSARFVGIKLTGDHLYAVVTDLRATVLSTHVHPLVSRDVDVVVGQLAEVVDAARQEFSRIAAVGICLAGDVQEHRDGQILLGSHFLGWDDVPLQRIVADRVGAPTWISNDVQALTMAHHWFGGGVGHESLAVIGFGEGIGVGIVTGGALLRGSAGHPGKVGHFRVRDDGPTCDRGHVGCVSAFVTAPALERNSGLTGYPAILDAARSGDERARRAVDDAVVALAVVVASLQNLADPEKIIVTGEGAPIARFDTETFHARIADRLDPAAEPVDLDIHDFAFADYAWGAAISAVRGLILQEGTP